MDEEGPRVNDALSYLDRVRTAFIEEHMVYDNFLEIMKNFKNNSLNTVGVIDEVKRLFHEHPELLVGFNQFLPAGYTVDNPYGPEGINHDADNGNSNPENSTPPNATPMDVDGGGTGDQTMLNAERLANGEFHMAVTYVSKIKKRFADDETTYNKFLEILQEYQTSQNDGEPNEAIDSVQEQIRVLFRGQPDLLDQFRYFLPTLAQGNSTLTGLMASNGVGPPIGSKRRRHGRQGEPPMKRQRIARHDGMEDDDDSDSGRRHRRMATRRSVRHRRMDYDSSSDGEFYADIFEIPRQRETSPPWTNDEEDKQKRMEMLFNELRRCLKPDTYDAIQKYHDRRLAHDPPRLLQALRGILKQHGEEKHEAVLCRFLSDSPYSYLEKKRGPDYFSFISRSELLQQCTQVQQSYRKLPDDVIQPRCQGRDAHSNAVLNDFYVSKPTGKEGGHEEKEREHGKDRRGNVDAEKALFQDEDDRFELDLMICTNRNCIKRLEDIQKYFQKNRDVVTLDVFSELDAIQRRTITRLYGDSGLDVLSFLKKDPRVGLSTLIRRMRAKDREWCGIREEMKETWRASAKRYNTQALDPSSRICHELDKKRRIAKHMLRELHESYIRCLKPSNPNNSAVLAPSTVVPMMMSGMSDEKNLLNEQKYEQMILDTEKGAHPPTGHEEIDLHHWRLLFDDEEILNDMTGILYDSASASESREEARQLKAFWCMFVGEVLDFTPHGLERFDSEPSSTEKDPKLDARMLGILERENRRAIQPGKIAAVDKTAIPPNAIGFACTRPSRIMFVPQKTWMFIRFTQMMYCRMKHCKDISSKIVQFRRMTHQPNDQSPYHLLVQRLHNLISHHLEMCDHESTCREEFGPDAYRLFTFDKLLNDFLISNDECCTNSSLQMCTDAFLAHRQRVQECDSPASLRRERLQYFFHLRELGLDALITVEYFPNEKMFCASMASNLPKTPHGQNGGTKMLSESQNENGEGGGNGRKTSGPIAFRQESHDSMMKYRGTGEQGTKQNSDGRADRSEQTGTNGAHDSLRTSAEVVSMEVSEDS